MNSNLNSNEKDLYNKYINEYQDPRLILRLIKPKKPLTIKRYLKKLIQIQTISFALLLFICIIQLFALWTNDWFVLNVNEYVQTAKGGLWKYCYLTAANLVGTLECFSYEDLPNFFVFAKDRLYDSRVLLLCSSGFLALLLIIECLGIFFIACSMCSCCDSCDAFLASRAHRISFASNYIAGYTSPQLPLKMYKSSDSFVVNNEKKTRLIVNTVKPKGYAMYLAFSLVTTVGSVLEFVLKTAGFAFFDGYINEILAFNRVFMAYRSFSYWAMVGVIVFMLAYWIFKVILIRYVIKLTLKLMQTDMRHSQKESEITREIVRDEPVSAIKEQKFKKPPKRILQRGRLDSFLGERASLDSESTVNINKNDYFQDRSSSLNEIYHF